MIGAKLAGRYEILREVGRGGMGVVYLAYDPLLEREVAVKVVPAAQLTTETEERFRREAKVIARMDHPSIVVVYDTGSHEGSLFFVMPYVPGANLRVLMQDRSLSLREVLDMGIQVAEALDYSHLRGIVHRDIKPENILITRSTEEGFRARITDFGLAVGVAEQRLTRSGAVVGTVAYLSPEQILSREIDGRSDLYSLATVIYECVVGDTPFVGEVHNILYNIANDLPAPPRVRGAAIDEELEQFILKCMEKDPGTRPQRARDAAEFLSRYRNNLQNPGNLPMMSAPIELRVMAREASIPLVGRDREYGELLRRMNDAAGSECQFVAISGEAGTGKTRLLEELEGAANSRKIRFLRGRFIEQDRSAPYQGYCEILQEYFRRKAPGSSVPADFSDLAADLVTLFPVLAEVFESKNVSSASVRLSNPRPLLEDRMAVFELLVRALTRISGGKPLVITMEDFHTADVSVEALQYIARRLGPTPTLIVATWRSSEIDKRHQIYRLLDSFQGDRRFVHMELEPLARVDHSLLLNALLGGARVNEAFASKIFEATEGNPYFTRELVRSLLESQRIVRSTSGSWTLSGETQISTDSLPATIQQTVERRVEGLAVELRDVLSVASVLGRNLEYRDLEMLAEDASDLEDRIERLIQMGFLQEERESRGDRLLFSSGVIRDVLYNGLSRRRKRVLHRKFAEHLESRFAGRLDRVYPQLLHHYQQVDHPEKVVEYGLKLAQKSLASFSPAEVLRAAKSVLDYVDEDHAGSKLPEAEAHQLIASALRMTGQIDAALKELAEAVQGYTDESRPELAVAAILQAAETAWEGRRIEETRTWVAKGIEAARAASDSIRLKKLLTIGTTVANMGGDYETAREYRTEAESLTTDTTATIAQLREGGEITAALALPIRAVHPSSILVDEESEVLANVFETLLISDASGNLAPGLCERWEVLEKGKSFLFTLRQGIRTHDGRVLTAVEVRLSIETALKVNRQAGRSIPAYTAIAGVPEYLNGTAEHVAGLLTFRENKLGIQLTESLPLYPALLTDLRTGIALESKQAGSKHPFVGTGPFRIVSAKLEQVVLERNPDPWDMASKLDRIVFQAGLSAAEIAGGFRSGKYDIAGDLLPADLEDTLRKPAFRGCLQETPKKNVYFILFNTASPKLADLQLRKALIGAIRTHDLIWRTLGRFAHPAEGLIPPGILGHDPGRRRQPMARQAITETLQKNTGAGPLRLHAAVHPILQDRYAALTGAMLRAWSDVGVEVDIAKLDMPEYLKTAELNEGYDIMIGRYVADYEDPDNFTFGLFHSREGDFRQYYSSEQLDHLMEEARAETNPSGREKLYRRVENLLLEGGVLLPLFHDVDYRLFHPGLAGVRLRSSPPYVNYSQIGRTTDSGPVVPRKTGGGLLRIPIPRATNSLNPALTFHTLQSEVISTIFETLTSQEEGATIAPWLASEVTPLEGGRKFRFRLRENLRFQDGRRVTARDVRYSFERALQVSESQSRAWYISSVVGAEDVLKGNNERLEGFHILSAQEFEVELDQQISFFPALVSSAPVAVVPEGLEDFTGSWRDGCVGTGPFRILRFDPGRRLELEPNPYYWRAGLPRVDGLVFHFDVEPDALASAFRQGEFSIVWNLAPAEIEGLRHDPQFAANYREIPSLSTYYIVFNIHEGPLQDEGLRHYISDLVNAEDIVRKTTGRTAVAASGLIPPGLLGHEARSRTRSSAHASKRPGELELTGMLHSVFDGPYQGAAREIFGLLRGRGVHVQLLDTRADVPNALVSAKTDLLLSRWMGDYPDADTFAHGLIHSHGQMGRFCGTREMDWLIDKARAETDARVRHSIYREIEEMILRRALLIPLFHEQSYRIARPEVMEFELRFGRPNAPYENFWIRK